MVEATQKLREYDFDDDGVRQCPAKVRQPDGAKKQCRTVVLCPAIFCRTHWRRLPHYLQDGIVQGMLEHAPYEEKVESLKKLVRDAIAFLLGP